MNMRLASFCLGLWGLGILAMGAARGLFDLEPGTVLFDAGAGMWVIGGVTYCFLGALELLTNRGH